jgi:tetratricopeptide (TPR) repeat protein
MLSKRDIMVVDLIAKNNWDRPIYFSITVGNSPRSYFWLDQYFQLEGLAYRFTPVKREQKNQGLDFGHVNTTVMYDKLMNTFSYGNMELPDVYLDETARRLTYNLRTIYGRLANKLIQEGDNERAIAVCDRAMEIMPVEKFGYDYFIFGLIEAYFKAGNTETGLKLANGFADTLDEELAYYGQFKGKKKREINQEVQSAAQFYQMLLQLTQQYKVGKPMTQDNMQENDLYLRYQKAVAPFGL